MSLIQTSVYPKSSLVGSGLWRNVECENIYPVTGCVDQFQVVDHAIGSR